MKSSDLEQLLNQREAVKAPPDFTEQVMNAIRAEQRTSPARVRRGYTAGLRLVAAALIALLLNLSPLLNQGAFARITDRMPVQDAPGILTQVPEAIEYYTQRISNLLLLPIRLHQQVLDEEESP
jgi:hypothetical protein